MIQFLDIDPKFLSDEDALVVSEYLFEYLRRDSVFDPYSTKKKRIKLKTGESIQHVGLGEWKNSPDEECKNTIGITKQEYIGGPIVLYNTKWETQEAKIQIVRKLSGSNLSMIILSLINTR